MAVYSLKSTVNSLKFAVLGGLILLLLIVINVFVLHDTVSFGHDIGQTNDIEANIFQGTPWFIIINLLGAAFVIFLIFKYYEIDLKKFCMREKHA